MSTTQLLQSAEANPGQAEALYKQVLSLSSTTNTQDPEEQASVLRDQETALVKLGELYRNTKLVLKLVNDI